MRAIIVLLALFDGLFALGGPFYLLIVMAYVNLDGPATAAVGLALAVCWVVAPWAALVVAWRASRRGAASGRIALILLAALVLALLGQGLVERLPLRGV